MLASRSDLEWERLARTDPYFGVLAEDRYRRGNLTRESLEEFFESGTRDVDDVLTAVRTHFDANFRPTRALDFGCGVGRLLIPLASICDEVIGFDVSESMLREARAHCDARGITNVTLLRGGDTLSCVAGTFDLIYSHIVFQHVRRPRGELLFKRMLELLRDGGVGAHHFLYQSTAGVGRRVARWVRNNLRPVHSIANLMQGRPFNDPLVQMNQYDLDRLVRCLQDFGCPDVYLRFTRHRDYLGAILFFRRVPRLP